MICPACKNDTPPDRKFCDFCGLALDLDDAKVEKTFAEELEEELRLETEERFQRISLLALVALMAVIGVSLIVGDPERPIGVAPAYILPAPTLPFDDRLKYEDIEVGLPPNG